MGYLLLQLNLLQDTGLADLGFGVLVFFVSQNLVFELVDFRLLSGWLVKWAVNFASINLGALTIIFFEKEFGEAAALKTTSWGVVTPILSKPLPRQVLMHLLFISLEISKRGPQTRIEQNVVPFILFLHKEVARVFSDLGQLVSSIICLVMVWNFYSRGASFSKKKNNNLLILKWSGKLSQNQGPPSIEQ